MRPRRRVQRVCLAVAAVAITGACGSGEIEVGSAGQADGDGVVTTVATTEEPTEDDVGQALAEAGDREEAEEISGQTDEDRAADEKAADEAWRAGLDRVKEGDDEAAVIEFTAAIELNPDNYEYYYDRATSYYYLFRYDDAIADYDLAIQLEPNNSELYSDRGVAKVESGDAEGGILDYDKAIELRPSYDKALANRAIAKDDLGRYEDSLIDYQLAIDANPNNAVTYVNRAVSHDGNGFIDLAIADLDTALEISPDYAFALYVRGVLHGDNGDLELALADFERFLEVSLPLDPNREFVEQAVADLEAGANPF